MAVVYGPCVRRPIAHPAAGGPTEGCAMAEFDPRALFERYAAAVNGGDYRILDEILHPDYEETWPQSGEHVRGIANMKAILENYPGGTIERGLERLVGGEDRWVITPSQTPLRIEGTGNVYTIVLRVRYPDGSSWYVVQVIEIKERKVWRVETYFAPLFAAPDWRAQWVDRGAARPAAGA
jgi:SnoaL-like domain